MKNKKILITTAAIASMLLMQSCLKDYQQVNTNPNQIGDTKPEFMFTAATNEYMRTSRADAMAQYDKAFIYTQYLVPNSGSSDGIAGNYITSSLQLGSYPNPGAGEYSIYFTRTGRDFRRLLAKIDNIQDPVIKKSYENLRAITVVMDTYEAWKVVDLYGGLPYNEGFDPAKYPTPKFDYGWDLYKVFEQKLKESVTTLKANAASTQQALGKQDFFYNGDWNKWLKFANSLRIKIAQRYEKRDAANLVAVLSDIAGNSNLIASNAESFGFTYSPDWGLNNYDDVDNIRKNYVAGYAFVEFLKSTSDPRIKFMVRDNDWGTNSPRYQTVRTSGTAASLVTLDSAAVNQSRYIGKRAFPLSAGDPAYGWNGTARDHSFALTTSAGSAALSYQSLIQTRLFVKNGGFKTGDAELHTDETVVTPNSIPYRLSIMNYADLCFMMAEIAAKGGNGLGKTAAQWYTDGVTASFDFYKAAAIANGTPGAASVTIGNLLTAVPYNGLQSIYSQAWVNFLVSPEEGYALIKRTGYPQFIDSRVGQPQKIGDGSGIAYLEKLYASTGEAIIPRRAALQYATAPEMQSTIDKAVADMFAKDANYLQERLNTKGRIWWDMQ